MKKIFIIFLLIFMSSCFGGNNKDIVQEMNTGEVIENPTESIIQEGTANSSEIQINDNEEAEVIL